MASRCATPGFAWLLSLALHAMGVGTGILVWCWSPTPAQFEAVHVRVRDVGPIEVIMLDSPEPRRLPSVAAIPLAEATAESAFSPIVPVTVQVPSPPLARPATTPNPPTGVTSQGSPAPATKPNMKPPGAATTFFGVAAVGKSVVFVVDRSASMGLERRLQRAIDEVITSLELLPGDAAFQVVAYARVPDLLRASSALMPATPTTVAAARAQLTALTAEGGTDHVRALKAALILQPDVVYFLTDEDDLTPGDVRSITDYNRGRTSIHAVCLVHPGSTATPLQELARRNRGEFRVAR